MPESPRSGVDDSSDFGEGCSTNPPRKYHLHSGPTKRSLLSDSISYTEPPAKRAVTMDDGMLSGDELDDFDLDDAEPHVRPASNFSVGNISTHSNGCRTLLSGITVSKKLVIKNFKKNSVAPDDLLKESWTILHDSIIAIQRKRKVASSLEQLYEIVDNLCENKLGGVLYEKLQTAIREHISHSRTYLTGRKDCSGDVFLADMETLWNDHCQQMTMIRNVFLFLDRNYILQNTSLLSVWECSLSIFREEVLDNSYIQQRLVKEILRVISLERKGDQVDRNLLRSLLRMLSSLHIYTQVFESEFLSSTEELFTYEGQTLSRDMDTADYLRHCQSRLEGEAARVDFYLDESTRPALFAITENCLIAKHMDLVLQKGLDGLLDGNHMEDLKLAFSLLQRVKDGTLSLKNGVVTYIKRLGKVLVMDPERDKTMVEDVMQFKQKLDKIVEQCFGNNEKFVQAERDAFSYFINTRPNKPAELIAKYMDQKLRVANKGASEDELDKLMDKVISLFRFIQGKDVFEAFYKKDLAKRLLLGRSASVDAEKAMLGKLKQECGSGFTHKLEGMFKDMEVSKDLAFAFRQHNDHEREHGRPSISMDFQVNVLTLGQWPPYELVEVTLPARMGSCLQMYQEFYDSKHNGRKLQWQHSLGQCTLKATFRPSCTKELQVSLYQAIVLLLFNDSNEFSYEEIATATKIDSKELRRTLVSLACGKIRVLNKLPKGKDVNDGDKFGVNTELQERLYRIKISQVQMKETEEEHKQTEEQVNQDRQYQIDAAVVRVMKTRKMLSHQKLIAELFAQLRFPVKSADLKKRIGSLIERDYITRDTEDTNTYKYVA